MSENIDKSVKVLISHVGIAVEDLESAIKNFSLITGENFPKIEDIPEHKVKVAMFGESQSADLKTARIELLEATTEDSPIAHFIRRRGEGLHHICIYVDDIEAKLAELQEKGVILIDKTPRIGADGNKIAFIHPQSANGVLMELEERAK